MTTVPFGRNFVPDGLFVPRGRWVYGSGFFWLTSEVGMVGFYVDIPSLHWEGDLVFHEYIKILREEVFTGGKVDLAAIQQAVRLLQGFLLQQFERKGLLVDARLSIGVALLQDSLLFVGGKGRFNVGVLREDEFHALMSCDEDEIATVSGYLEGHDLLAMYVSTYPVEELCLQLSMEDDDKEQLYSGYLNTYPSKGMAMLYEYDTSVMMSSVEHLDEKVIPDEKVPATEVSVEDVGVEAENWVAVPTTSWSRNLALAMLNGIERTQRMTKRFTRRLWGVSQPVLAFLDSRILSYLAVLILLVCGWFVFAGKPFEKIWQEQRQAALMKAEQLPPLRQQLEEVKSLMGTSPVRASRMMVTLRSQAQALDPAIRDSAEGKAFQIEVEALYGTMTKAVAVEAPLFFDISTVGNGAKADSLSLVKDALLVADTHKDAVYRVDLGTRASRAMLGSGDGVSGSFAVLADERALYSLSAAGIIRLSFSAADTKKILDRDPRWSDPKAAALFGGNIYVFDVGASQVWKYTGNQQGFGSGSAFLNGQTSYGFEQGSSIAVDGYVWLGFSNGNVVRLAQGGVDSFTLESLTDPLEQVKAIVAPEDQEYLYVLDTLVGRVVQFRKETGGFVQQFVNPIFKGAGDLVIDAENSTGYVTKDSLIYRFNLQ